MISLAKLKIMTPLQKLSKNVRDLGKLILPRALKSCPKSNISPNLVTLNAEQKQNLLQLLTHWANNTPHLPLPKCFMSLPTKAYNSLDVGTHPFCTS